ncbi:MAG: energy-coupling factor transporter ATPase [Lachnospiraceae bacterium]
MTQEPEPPEQKAPECGAAEHGAPEHDAGAIPPQKGLCLDHVSYVYDPDAPNPVKAIDDVSLVIPEDQFVGVIGHTGSGKSTLMQLLNGLLRPTAGRVYLDGQDVFAEGYQIRNLRFSVGLVFQYPEHQLFEETVFKDVCFGPKNQGLSPEEQKKKAEEALRLVDLPEEFWDSSPFELSGGQKRRAAIAGVLAMEPRYLILDEPTAGLDPKGRDEILGTVERLRRERRMTVVLVSHSMEDVAVYAGRLLVVDHGKILFDDTPRSVFRHRETLEKIGLALPQMMYLAGRLRDEGFDVPGDVLTVPEAEQAILRCLR